MAFNKKSYDAEFHRQAYDRVVFVVPKGKKKTIQDYAEDRGISMGKLIIEALETMYDMDLSK